MGTTFEVMDFVRCVLRRELTAINISHGLTSLSNQILSRKVFSFLFLKNIIQRNEFYCGISNDKWCGSRQAFNAVKNPTRPILHGVAVLQ